MSQVMSKQQESTSSTSLKYQRVMSVTFWTMQAMLAILFLLVGGMKLIVPVEVLVAQMPIKLPGLFVRFIGICEVAGAFGLICLDSHAFGGN